LKIHDIQTL